MNENTIISGKSSKKNVPAIVSLVVAVIGFFLYLSAFNAAADHYAIYYLSHNFFTFGLKIGINGIPALIYYLMLWGGLVATIVFLLKMNGCEIYVSETQVSGKAAFKKNVKIPTKQISSLSVGAFGSITVATSSEKSKFWMISNRDDIYNVLSTYVNQPVNDTKVSSEAEELKRYKELLDNGVISQEEFDAKKKRLLGL